MVDLNNTTKRKLGSIFDMSSDYVLDFNNVRLADFVKIAIDIAPYEKCSPTSKKILFRAIWNQEPIIYLDAGQFASICGAGYQRCVLDGAAGGGVARVQFTH